MRHEVSCRRSCYSITDYVSCVTSQKYAEKTFDRDAARRVILSMWLERAQKIDDFLLLLNGQPIEVFDDLIGLAAVALVSPNGVNQVGRTPIMEKEDALSDAPERTGPELVGAGAALCNAVGQAFAHVRGSIHFCSVTPGNRMDE